MFVASVGQGEIVVAIGIGGTIGTREAEGWDASRTATRGTKSATERTATSSTRVIALGICKTGIGKLLQGGQVGVFGGVGSDGCNADQQSSIVFENVIAEKTGNCHGEGGWMV